MYGPRSGTHKLQQLRNPECTACALHKSSVNVCIMGRGNSGARIMLVGEAPGEREADTGKPFMGKSGKLLNELLEELEMEHLVYISNIARCRPPENRKPTPQEVKTCTDLYLLPELQIVKPYIVVGMGRTAIDFFMRGRPFERGKVVFMRSLLFIPTWHPSYVARTQREDWWSRDQFKAHLHEAEMWHKTRMWRKPFSQNAEEMFSLVQPYSISREERMLDLRKGD